MIKTIKKVKKEEENQNKDLRKEVKLSEIEEAILNLKGEIRSILLKDVLKD